MNLDSSLDGDIFNALNQLGKSSYWNELRQGLVNQGETNQWFLHTVYHRIRDIPFVCLFFFIFLRLESGTVTVSFW